MSLFKKGVTEEGNAPVSTAKRRKWKKKTVVLMVVALAAVIAVSILCWKLFFAQEERQIRTGETTFGALSATIEGTGVTLPNDSVTYTTASSSEILEVCVSAGDTVKEGDLLYRQDDSEIDEEIDEYKDEIGENEDSLIDYYDQLEDLYEEMGSLTVTAPVAGHLLEVKAEEGDTVRVGDILAVLVDDAAMTLKQYFSYAYEDQVYVGMEAMVSIPGLMLNKTGTVTEIHKVERITTEGTKCFAVTIEVDNPGALTEGMEAGGYLLAGDGSKLYPAIGGTLEYAATKTITAQASGEITSCPVQAYQRVTAGERLFVIAGDSYETQLKNLNTQISRAEEKIATLNERIAEAEEKRENYAVRSEIDGTVIMVSVREGTTTQAGRTAVMIYNLDSMSITVNIDELDIEYVTAGMDVTIVRSGAESDQVWTGTVSEVSLEASNSGGVSTFPVTIDIPSEGELSAGVSVSYYIRTGDSEEGVLAPVAAVQYTDEGTCLFIRADSRPENAIDLKSSDLPEGFYAVPVETGTSNARYTRILSGAEEGMTLFLGYVQRAPGGGNTTSQGSGANSEFPQMGLPDFSGGQMPNFGGGNMPSFGGSGGGMPGMGGGGGMGPRG